VLQSRPVGAPLRIAAVQTVPHAGDVGANTAAHLAHVAEAARRGASVVLFPELSLTGYELSLADELAFRRDDPRLAPLSSAAVGHGLTLVVGLPLRLDAGLHIACAILGPDGGRDFYTKRHVHSSEAPPFVPGELDPLLRLGARSAAIGICADTKHPSHAARAAERGATLYLVSAFFMPSGYATEMEHLRSHARTHGMDVVLANYGGPSGGLDSEGRSAVLRADGTVVESLGREGAGLVLVELD